MNVPANNRKRIDYLYFYGMETNTGSMMVVLHFRVNSSFVYRHTWAPTTGQWSGRYFSSCGVDCFWDTNRIENWNWRTNAYDPVGNSFQAQRLDLANISGFLPSNPNATLASFPLERYELSGYGLFIRLVGIAGLNQSALPVEAPPAPQAPSSTCNIDESRVYDILEDFEFNLNTIFMLKNHAEVLIGGPGGSNIRFITEGGDLQQRIQQDGAGNAPGSLIPQTSRFPCGPGYPSRKNRHDYSYDAYFGSTSGSFPWQCNSWNFNWTLVLPSLRRFNTSKLFITGTASQWTTVSLFLKFENIRNMSYPFEKRVDVNIPASANDDLVNCTAPSCYPSLKGIMGGGRAGDAFTFWGGTWTGLYPFRSRFSPLHYFPPLSLNNRTFISV
jgi:hypothetical protein